MSVDRNWRVLVHLFVPRLCWLCRPKWPKSCQHRGHSVNFVPQPTEHGPGLADSAAISSDARRNHPKLAEVRPHLVDIAPKLADTAPKYCCGPLAADNHFAFLDRCYPKTNARVEASPVRLSREGPLLVFCTCSARDLYASCTLRAWPTFRVRLSLAGALSTFVDIGAS